MGGNGRGGGRGRNRRPSTPQKKPESPEVASETTENSVNTDPDVKQQSENASETDPFVIDVTGLSPDLALLVKKLQIVIRKEVDRANKNLETKVDNLSKRIDDINDQIVDVIALQDTVSSIKADAQVMKTKTLPNFANHMNFVVTHLALQNIDLNMHRRKSNLIIQGVDGEEGESSDDTRKAIITMAKTKLKLKDSKDNPLNADQLAACHRLSSSAGSAVIARFVDLRQRDRWLAHAKQLAKTSISMSVDVPPCLRKAKNELMALRKELSPEEKKQSFVKHLPTWPYLVLHRKGQDPIHHSFSKADIIAHAIKLPDGEKVLYELPAD